MALFNILTQIQEFLQETVSTFSSIIKILVYPRCGNDMPITRPSEDLVILGNGPSLKPFLSQKKAFYQGKAILSVNYAALADSFQEIQPSFYMLIDPAFFFNPSDRNKLFPVLCEKVSWPMHLFVSAQARKEESWKKLIEGNKCIKIHYISIAPIEGYKWFCHLAYRNGWGMPRPRNVLIPSIMIALRMDFKRIYLAGADHSWIKEIWVDEDNRVIEDLQHFYDKKGSVRSTIHHPLHELLFSMYVAFKSYHIIREYSQSIHKEIFNITEGSFIDAFDRIKI